MGKDIEEGKNTTQFNCVHFSENSSFLQWCFFFAISLFYVNGICCDIPERKRNKIPTKEQAHRTLWFICVIGKQNDKLYEHDGWFNSFFLSIFFSTLVVSLFFSCCNFNCTIFKYEVCCMHCRSAWSIFYTFLCIVVEFYANKLILHTKKWNERMIFL